MRISDILASHARPGTVVLDLTSALAGAELSPSTWLPPDFGLVYTREPAPESPRVPSLVLHDLPVHGADLAPSAPALVLGEPSAEVVHIVFFDRVEALVDQGLLARATEQGWELAGTHVTQSKVFRFAAVLAAPAPDGQSTVRLRMVNEYRYGKFCLRIREDQMARLEERVEKAEGRARRHEKDAEIARAEVVAMRGDQERLAQDLERARASAGQMRQRLVVVEEQLQRARSRLIATRRSVSFRLGRATKVALRDSRPNLLGLPRKWLATFRGPDELLADLDRKP